MSETVEARVWVPSGNVTRNSILKRAVESVRDTIPVVSELSSEITDSAEKDQDGVKGREYVVTVTYTPRPTAEAEAVDVDHVVESLAPPQFDTILSHPEDAA